ncbi:MAG: hypothetical protein MUC87_13860 [Bacteroidia bacterium]|jgi:hypothetical protein|nr:hypothetical protein [Bacteroidia bacterium]
MKKLFFPLVASAFLFTAMVPAEVCESDLFVKGVSITTSTFDEKGKLVSTGTSTIKEVEKTAVSVFADMHVSTVDAKSREMGSADVKMRCENGKFYMDMKNFASSNNTRMGADFSFDFEGIDIEYPSVMSVGMNLRDAHVIMTTKNNGSQFSTTTIKMYNRKVVARENKTTPAGTFDCWKIEYDIDFEMVMAMGKLPIKPRHSIEWFTPKIGAVYTESYKEGKLESHSETTKIVKP